MNEYKALSWQGLWKNNPALGAAIRFMPFACRNSNYHQWIGFRTCHHCGIDRFEYTVSIIRNWVPSEIRIPIFVMIIAAFVTIVQLLMNAYTFTLYQALGIFIPLIVTNCAIIGRAEAYASKNTVGKSAFDGLMMDWVLALY